VPIQSFDMATGKAKDPARFQSVVFLRDEADIETVSALLRKSRHPLLGRVDNLRDAMELVRKHKKGVIYLDADWPGMKIEEVLAGLVGRFPDFNVIITKANATKEELVALRQQGAAGFILKPVNAESVAKVLARL